MPAGSADKQPSSPSDQTTASSWVSSKDDAFRLHTLLDKVFRTMDDHYYLPVSKSVYEDFVRTYPVGRLKAINEKSRQTEDFIHLGGGLLVNKLKDPSDRFTNFIPPVKVKPFKQAAYAVTEDLGIEGAKEGATFRITKVQKYCQAFEKNVRPADQLLKIDGISVSPMTEEVIRKRLSPELGSITRLEICFAGKNKTEEIELESKSYFRETVATVSTDLPGVLILKIEHFNQKTCDDFADEVSLFGAKKVRRLILDLRGNEGGPPLAAREILGYFLPQNDFLFAISRKKQRPVMLTAPLKPIRIDAPATVLVNERTGSAAEMFSGLLQAKKIATLVGQKTAGATYLKSNYDFEDGSMLFMITSLTFFFDRRVFPANGLTPDVPLDKKIDSLDHVLRSLRSPAASAH